MLNPLQKTISLCLILFINIVIFSNSTLNALEIRLLPPIEIYAKNGNLYADFLTSENLLDEPSAKNFVYNIPFTITYYIELHKKRFLLNKLVADIEIIKHVRQDLWSKHFFVIENGNEIRFANYSALNKYLTSLNQVSLTNTEEIDLKGTYFVKTRIAIKIRNFDSFYYLINNLVSLFEYRTSYLNSKPYLGEKLIKNRYKK